mmetsp:Transcript_113259/g.283676  ORF Transcript_113259/g.283676 Transcript_113259/m.283676 type:complete len:403 (+) Transcript_113259:428-1636(+)
MAAAAQRIDDQWQQHLVRQVPVPQVCPKCIETEPLALPPRLRLREPRVRLQGAELARGLLLDQQHALREVARGVAVRHDVGHVARHEVAVGAVRHVEREHEHHRRVHGGQGVPIKTCAQNAEQDGVPNGVRKVPYKHIDDQRGDDVEVHANEESNPEPHHVEVGRQAEQGAEHLEYGHDAGDDAGSESEVIVRRWRVMRAEHQPPIPLSPRSADHVLCAHEVAHVEVLEPRPYLAPPRANVEPREEELDPDHLSLADFEAHRNQHVQVLCAIAMHVLSIVEDKLVELTSVQGPHQIWCDLCGAQTAGCEEVGEHALDQNVDYVAGAGEARHEGGVVLQRARRPPVPPICEGWCHLRMERAVDNSQPETLPQVPIDDQLLYEGEPREFFAVNRSGERKHCREA